MEMTIPRFSTSNGSQRVSTFNGETAVLLIDFENFFLSREFQQAKSKQQYDAAGDVEQLMTFTRDLCGGRRLIVKRAYADFNSFRWKDKRREFYLRNMVEPLMENGIEPVQVFRFSGGNSKNAADMRMAMDAGGLTLQGSLSQYVLVTGDADFVPVCLELRRRGALVTVIGVNGSTSNVVQRYCDRFEFFEEMMAAHSDVKDVSTMLVEVKRALHKLVQERGPLKFAAVKPLLGSRLQGGFRPEDFEFDNVGDFLREFESQLGFDFKHGKDDWELHLPQQQRDEPTPQVVEVENRLEHSSDTYRQLLRAWVPKIFVRPLGEWESVTSQVMSIASSDEPFTLRSLQQQLEQQCLADEMPNADTSVRHILYQLRHAQCFVPIGDADDLDGSPRLESHQPIALSPDIVDVDALRQKTQRAMIELLRSRLVDRGITGDLDEPSLAKLLFGDDPGSGSRVAELVG